MRRINQILLERLEHWGDWSVSPVRGIGYSEQTVEARMMEYGGITSGGEMEPPDYMGDRRAREVEDAILAIDADQQVVMRAYYVYRMTDPSKLAKGWGSVFEFMKILEHGELAVAKILKINPKRY